ncbi:DUF6153 family protein [Paramicrobacterium agarici]|uniref:DUF6153 family protein n=1 Tax=Paramicrobacterium agarici TaxID=630514 RepID=UPI001150BCFC|nr:DUF6153 family protein [Microbacterium agarici]TQO22611.1 hypothetical protein FB385_1443 [Microbacterium agarici]
MLALREYMSQRVVPSRNLLVSLGAVLLIIAGLLAMHSLNLGSEHSDGSTSPVPAASTVLATDPVPAGAPDGEFMAGCIGACNEGHAVAVMGCVLALLVTSLLLVTPALLARLVSLSPATARSFRFYAELDVAAAPPSLHALSISRT